jgi:hypothetical protein
MKLMAKGVSKKAARSSLAMKMKAPHLKALAAVNRALKKVARGKGRNQIGYASS